MKTNDMARALGARGGRARARRLSVEDRRRIASLGGIARRQSLDLARRIVETLEYARSVEELRGTPQVVRVRRCRGVLPGLYPDRG